MEFLKQNQLLTTTMLTCPAAQTGTLAYLFDRNRDLGFTSVGYDSNTSLVLSIVFPTPTVLSTLLLQKHNLADYRVFYNSVTANSLAIVTQNSETSTRLQFNSITVSSISIQMDRSQTPATERRIGELVATERRLQFERNPSSKDFQPVVARKRIRHEMPDGGMAHFNIKNKYKARLNWKFLTTSFVTSLRSVYDEALPLYFVPFPTATAWDGVAHEVLWDNDFDFADDENSRTQGQGGEIKLWETANT